MSGPALVDRPKPPPNEIRPSRANNFGVRMPDQEDQRLRANVTAAVQAQDPAFTQERATPPTQVQPPAGLKNHGATLVGEGANFEPADVAKHLEYALQPVTGQSIWARIGRALRGHRIVGNRAAKLARERLNPKQDKDALNIGE